MPHMSNLPWMSMCVMLFLIVILTYMIFSFPKTSQLIKSKNITNHLSNKNKWLW